MIITVIIGLIISIGAEMLIEWKLENMERHHPTKATKGGEQ